MHLSLYIDAFPSLYPPPLAGETPADGRRSPRNTADPPIRRIMFGIKNGFSLRNSLQNRSTILKSSWYEFQHMFSLHTPTPAGTTPDDAWRRPIQSLLGTLLGTQNRHSSFNLIYMFGHIPLSAAPVPLCVTSLDNHDQSCAALLGMFAKNQLFRFSHVPLAKRWKSRKTKL